MNGRRDVRASLAFRKKLKRISDDLTSSEVTQLKFLAAERIPAGVREHINTAQKLFEALEQRCLLQADNMDYLIRMLHRIGRKDVITKHQLELSGRESREQKVEEEIDNSFASLLQVLSEQIVSAELEAMKTLAVDYIPRGRLQYVTNSLSFFGEMESIGELAETNLTLLQDLLEAVGRVDLVGVVDTFISRKKVVKPSGRGGHVTPGGVSPGLFTQQRNAIRQSGNGDSVETGPVIAQPSDDSHGGPRVFNDHYGEITVPEEKRKCSHSHQNQRGEMLEESMVIEASSGSWSATRDRGSSERMREDFTSDRQKLGAQVHGEAEQQYRAQDSTQGQLSELHWSLRMQKEEVTQPSAPAAQIDHQSVQAELRLRELETRRERELEAQRETERQLQLRENDLKTHRGRERELQAQLDEMTSRLQHVEAQGQQSHRQLEQAVGEARDHLEQERRRRQDMEAERQRIQEEVARLRVEQQLQQTRQPAGADLVLECYPMTRNPRGFAVIISNEHFPNSRANLTDRQGSERDVQNLKKTFEKLNFIVRIHRNLIGFELVATMRQYGAHDHSSYDCFVCCMLSHGKKDCIYGSNSEPVSIEQLTSQVDGLSCPSLLKKPKLFFIQACRGTGEDLGVETDAGGLSGHAQRDALEQVKIPLKADYLLGFASPPGNVSFRSTTHGSWYISALVSTLETYAGRGVSLTDMLIMVNQRLAEATTSDGFKQIPSPINQLTKRLVFSPTTH